MGAVTQHQVANLEHDQIESHAKFAESIKQKKLQSNLRVRSRLKERKRLLVFQKQKNSSHGIVLKSSVVQVHPIGETKEIKLSNDAPMKSAKISTGESGEIEVTEPLTNNVGDV